MQFLTLHSFRPVSDLFQTCFKPLFGTQKKKKRYWTSNFDDTHVEELGYNCPGLPRANAIEFGDDSIWVRCLNDGTMMGQCKATLSGIIMICDTIWVAFTFELFPLVSRFSPLESTFSGFLCRQGAKKVKLLYFEGCPSWHYFVIVSDDISSGSIYGTYFLTFYSGILSDTLFWHSVQFYSGILPSIYSDIFSGVLPGISSEILCSWSPAGNTLIRS